MRFYRLIKSKQSVSSNSATVANTNAKVLEIKAFFNDDLPRLIKSIFTEPIEGTFDIFSGAGKSIQQCPYLTGYSGNILYYYSLFNGR